MAFPAVMYFSSLSYTRHDFRKQIIAHKVWLFNFLYNFCLKNFWFSELHDVLL
jgi:hypothetical protein